MNQCQIRNYLQRPDIILVIIMAAEDAKLEIPRTTAVVCLSALPAAAAHGGEQSMIKL